MSISKRDVIKTVLDFKKPPYIPWTFNFTYEAAEKLLEYYETKDIESILDNHILAVGNAIGFFQDIGNGRVRDAFGVCWDRTKDKDIGIVEGLVLPEPTLKNYEFPDPLQKRFYADIPEQFSRYGDRLRCFCIGFSLYERAWTLRGMENLMMDFISNPQFVHELFNTIADYYIVQIKKALEYDIDAVFFGDDWGQQSGLQMGPKLWHEFIFPVLKRMYGVVKQAGKYVIIHSCGDVDELFDDLVAIGLNCFNPFQPEVMDVYSLMHKYKNKLAFYGGLSTQKTLPYGTVSDVKNETERLLEAGKEGGYILSPAHAVEGDVPVENMVAFIEYAQNQAAYKKYIKKK